MTDRQLLEQFRSQHDPSAFEAIVSRYGPLVRRVGRDVLGSADATDDLFQATFLVLLQNADSIRDADLLGPWLHGVAYRVAIRTRQQSAKRPTWDSQSVELAPDPDSDPSRADRDEQFRLIHEELNRLPDRLRDPIWLCHMEGLTYEAAADRLQCPLGTFKARLSQARSLLRSRLARRGVSLPAGLLLAMLVDRASASTTEELIEPTVQLGQTWLEGASVPEPLEELAALAPDPPRSASTWTKAGASLGVLALLIAACFGGCTWLYPSMGLENHEQPVLAAQNDAAETESPQPPASCPPAEPEPEVKAPKPVVQIRLEQPVPAAPVAPCPDDPPAE